MGRRGHLPRIGRLLVVLFAGHGRSQREDLVGVCVHQEEVVVRRRLLLAAGLLLMRRGMGGTLATALRAVDGPSRGALQRQGAGGAPARVTLRRHAESTEGVRQDGQHVLHPRGGLGLTQLAGHTMHGVQGARLLRDEHAEQLVCPL